MKTYFFDSIKKAFGRKSYYDSNSLESVDTLRAGDMSGGKCGLISSTITVTEPSTCINPGQVKVANVAPNGKTPNSESGQSLRDDEKTLFSPLIWRLIEISAAELIGTACLMFFGCMGAPLTPFEGAIVFGLVVCTLIQIFGHISSAHFNPAVTITAIVLGKITPVTAVVYFVAEFLGAILGLSLLKIITPSDLWDLWQPKGAGVCVTAPVPSLSDTQALSLEFLATTFLILVVCSVWDERNADKPDSVPLKFAVTITVISSIVGPLTGASMNPARSLAPAIINGVWTKHWIYWVGPLSAGFLASVFYQLVFDRKKFSKPEVAEEVPLTGVIGGGSKSSTQNLRQSSEKQGIESQTR